ncbi:hypothetical protein OEB99_04845 [Actinotalea sp. M2MS4P-6]|uniref:hypothetical protein n=1 Tax=Actinotalea sp. M2MS4P-6 TaxID=2983762 RepID=UPI0021E46ABD|nr:hypothetical protein [Actinotalea sp. M2MS4P-6]MCV2393629.1 hypothetical protein [Actinotalea sp. M2MS4P-6]
MNRRGRRRDSTVSIDRETATAPPRSWQRRAARGTAALTAAVCALAAAGVAAPGTAAAVATPASPAAAAVVVPAPAAAAAVESAAPRSAAGSATGAAAAAARAVPTATDYTDGLRVEASTTFTVDLDGPTIHVVYVATLTNTTPDSYTQSYRTQYYFTTYAAPVLEGATGVTASRSGGGALGVSVEEQEGYLPSALVQLSPRLYYRQSQTIQITYDVPPQPLRSGSMSQVNGAFATFPAFTSADPGLADVTVVLPRSAEEELVGEQMACTHGTETTTCTATDIADPGAWYTTVVARDDDALVENVVTAGDKEVHVYAWPGDTEWLDFTTDAAERGIPALTEAFGRSWGVRPRLDIVETSTPYLYGYAGWYQLDASLIEIGDELDLDVALHEIAHAWLNGETFGDRWVLEGLASEYASLAMTALGADAPVPDPVDTGSAVAVPLLDWAVPDPTDPDAEAIEEYGYGASWLIAHALVDEIGEEAMSKVVLAGADSLSPYPASTSDDRLPATPGWRSYLDLLEEVGGSEQADELFRTYVVGPSDAAVLDARATARDSYAELIDAGDGWAPPAAVRDAMTEWRFVQAAELMPPVRELLDVRDGIAAALSTVDADVPTSLQRQFEAATDLTALDERMSSAADAVDAYVQAASAAADANAITRLGLLAAPVAGDLEDATAALEAGDWPALASAAAQVDDGLGTATRVGGIALGAVALLVAGAVTMVLLRRRRASRPVPGVPVGDGPSDPAGAPQPGPEPADAQPADPEPAGTELADRAQADPEPAETELADTAQADPQPAETELAVGPGRTD